VDQAVDLLHAADVLHHLVRARLVRASIHRSLGRLDEAESELDVVQRYFGELCFRLLGAVGELVRAWARYALGDVTAAREHLHHAEEVVLATRYGRRTDELAVLRSKLFSP
jgi:hypothetical protein